MKLAGSNPEGKIIALFLITIPIFIVGLIVFVKQDFELLLTKGYLIYFTIYFTLAFFYLKWTVFSASIYDINNICVVKTPLLKAKEYKKIKKISVNSIFILSFLFSIYKVKINEDRFNVGLSTPNSIFERLFNQTEIAKRLEETITRAVLSPRPK